jgi:hypothetical protein
MSKTDATIGPGFAVRVVLKAAVLFLAINLLFAVFDPLPLIGKLSLYHTPPVAARTRLPFGENPASYNLSLFQIDAMFASHEISTPKPADEYRVVLIGDSSVWGFLLWPDETLAARLSARGYQTADGRTIKVYNLGYPTVAVSKDLLLLSYALDYDPDLVIWLTTLEALPLHKQVTSPIVQHNAAHMQTLITGYDLPIDPGDPAFVKTTFWDKSLIGRRRMLADIIRLNLYGIMWTSTGIDQFYPDTYQPREEDFEPDASFYDLSSPLRPDDLALDVLATGVELAGDVPVLFVNEPMFISSGANSHIRYNFYYPRWAYDDYRAIMAGYMAQNGWGYVDLWDAIPATEYTNSAIHLTPEGTAQLASILAQELEWGK